MSYLAQPTSKLDYGVVKIGDFINVQDGIISLAQDLSTTSTVAFSTGTFNSLYVDGKSVVTEITPTAGAGILLTNVITTGTSASFTVSNTGVLSVTASAGISVSTSTGNITVVNTGVLSLTAGSGIALSTSTGNITISSFGADLINVYGTSTNYTATLLDEYIGVSSSAAVIITLPAGVAGRVYTIKDEFGQGSGKITIQPQPGELVDKKVNYIISVPNQSVGVVFRAGSWWII
jgi:hypothetical protein